MIIQKNSQFFSIHCSLLIPVITNYHELFKDNPSNQKKQSHDHQLWIVPKNSPCHPSDQLWWLMMSPSPTSLTMAAMSYVIMNNHILNRIFMGFWTFFNHIFGISWISYICFMTYFFKWSHWINFIPSISSHPSHYSHPISSSHRLLRFNRAPRKHQGAAPPFWTCDAGNRWNRRPSCPRRKAERFSKCFLDWFLCIVNGKKPTRKSGLLGIYWKYNGLYMYIDRGFHDLWFLVLGYVYIHT